MTTTATIWPDQPDDIDTTTTDLPTPDNALARVNAYIRETGDGLYDVTNGQPLYARDLTSLSLAAQGEMARLSTPYRISADGVLARREVRQAAGWMQPHWVVLYVPSGEYNHHLGQRLHDQAVTSWETLWRHEGNQP